MFVAYPFALPLIAATSSQCCSGTRVSLAVHCRSIFPSLSVGACSTHVVSQAVLSRSSSEWVTNIVMDYGDSVLYTVEVCEGAAFPHAKPRVDLAVWGLREHILTLFLRGLMADTSD